MKLAIISHPAEKRKLLGYLILSESGHIEIIEVDPESDYALAMLLNRSIVTPYGTFDSSDAANWMALAPDWLSGDYLSIEEIED